MGTTATWNSAGDGSASSAEVLPTPPLQPAGNHERRWHPLLEQWVIIAAATGQRPWSGQPAENVQARLPQHDPNCYLCPGVERAGGHVNPEFTGPFAFDNDFASLAATAPELSMTTISGNPALDTSGELPGVQRRAAARGACRVVVWSERHDLTLPELSSEAMAAVARRWQAEVAALYQREGIVQVCLFENKGREIGMSNPHPHGQIYALDFVSDHARRMRAAQQRYREVHGVDLLMAFSQTDHAEAELWIEAGEHFITLVPFAARFPYETWIVPRDPLGSITDLTDAAVLELGRMVQRQAQRYDALFERAAPNTTLFHDAPRDEHPGNAYFCFHVVMQPPLINAGKQKFLAGFESLSGNIVNPVQPEQAAAVLRQLANKK